MSSSTALPARLSGAHFLTHDVSPDDVFTPEDLSIEDRQMAYSASKFMEQEVFPRLDDLEAQKAGVARSLFKQAGELGLLGLEVPEEFGGLGLGKRSAIGVNEQLSRLAGFGITCAAHSGIGSQPLIYFGTAGQKQKYLPRLATGEWMAAYCLSEAGSGSDALGMRTKAQLTSDGKHYVLNGVKMWITNAAWADLFTVFAKVDGEHVTAFLVEREFAGISTGREEHKLGIKSSSTRRLILDDVRVPVENVLGEVGKGAYIAFNILNFGRYSLGAGIMGPAKEQIRIAARYASERQQFGKPLASFGLIRQKLVEMAAQVYAGESATYRTAGLIDEVTATGETLDSINPPFLRSLDEFALECSILKVRCSEILFAVADEALQIHGGYGFTEEFPPARVLRDSRINRIFEGTNEINRLFIPGVLLRRAQRGRFALRERMTKALAEAENHEPPADTGNDLQNAQTSLTALKRLVFFLFAKAERTFGSAMSEEQEVLAGIADTIAELYLAESAVLRAIRARTRSGSATVHCDLAIQFLHDAIGRIELAATRTTEACVARKDFPVAREIVHRLTTRIPPDAKSLRTRIANALFTRLDYPL